MKSFLSRKVLQWWGWRIEGQYPYDIPKKIFAVVPHTSAWDFLVGVLVRSALRADIGFIAKHTLFKPPLGWFMSAMGGIPVDRRASSNFVDAVVAQYNARQKIAIAIAPEGTRKKVSSLKTGFYYIAKLARIPIIPVQFNYGDKVVHFGPPFMPSDDEKGDLEALEQHFKGVQGKKPEYSFG